MSGANRIRFGNLRGVKVARVHDGQDDDDQRYGALQLYDGFNELLFHVYFMRSTWCPSLSILAVMQYKCGSGLLESLDTNDSCKLA